MSINKKYNSSSSWNISFIRNKWIISHKSNKSSGLGASLIKIAEVTGTNPNLMSFEIV